MLRVLDIEDNKFNISHFINTHHNEYTICVFGGAFTDEGEPYNRPGYFSGTIHYNQYKKVFDENCKSVKSANHVMLLGISKMLNSINIRNKHINIFVATPLGFSYGKSSKGANKECVIEIIEKCESIGSSLTVFQWKNGSERLKRYINNEILNE